MAKKKEKVNPVEEFFKSFSGIDSEIDFKFGHEVFSDVVDVVSTTSLVLDDALSAGGLPKGKLIQYYGPPASGKSLFAMLAIRQAQKDDPKAIQIFIDAEQTFNVQWASQLGLNISRIGLIQGETAAYGQKLFEKILGVPKEDKKHKYVGKSKPGLLDKIADGTMNVNMIVLDSLGAIIPPGIDVASVGQITMGKMAKFLTETFAKLSVEVNKANVPFIVINHVRAGMDPYGPDHTFSGGNAYAHHLSANVYFESVNRKDSNITDDNGNKIGGVIRAVVEKSKFGPHPRRCEFNVDFRRGVIDLHEQVAELAISYGIINQLSTVSYEYGDHKWVGKSKVAASIGEDNSLFEELKLKIEELRSERRTKQIEAQNEAKQEFLEEEEDLSETTQVDQVSE
jgi:recombination protein RecA